MKISRYILPLPFTPEEFTSFWETATGRTADRKERWAVRQVVELVNMAYLDGLDGANGYPEDPEEEFQAWTAEGGYGWPGKPQGTAAVSRYPNIAAELAASGYWLKTMCEFADVSPEVMAAVIKDGEELTEAELWRLAEFLGNPGYLSAPVLQLVDPATNKGKRRRRELADRIQEAAELPDPVEDVYGLHTYWRREACQALDSLNAGTAVTFASWWWACEAVRNALRVEASKSKCIRTERRSMA